MKRRFSWLNIVFFILHSVTMWSKVFPLKAALQWMGQNKNLIIGRGAQDHKNWKFFMTFAMRRRTPPPLMVLFLIHFLHYFFLLQLQLNLTYMIRIWHCVPLKDVILSPGKSHEKFPFFCVIPSLSQKVHVNSFKRLIQGHKISTSPTKIY